jgi:hypothetical protein
MNQTPIHDIHLDVSFRGISVLVTIFMCVFFVIIVIFKCEVLQQENRIATKKHHCEA